MRIVWPASFTKPTPGELKAAPGGLIFFQGVMAASAPNDLRIVKYRGSGGEWRDNA